MAIVNWAAPSWVIPGSVVKNAMFLTGKTPGIALCLFETAASLAYSPQELPPGLGKLPFNWHIHLPLDLPWQNGPRAVADICSSLCSKTAFLAPELAVLHPPERNCRKMLSEFASFWGGSPKIVIENTVRCDILQALGASFLAQHGFGFCMDVGHALGYSQLSLLQSDLPASALVWHWSAPGRGDKHLPLTRLTPGQKRFCASLIAAARPDAIHVLEIFNWPGILESLPIIAALFQEKANDPEIGTDSGIQALASGIAG